MHQEIRYFALDRWLSTDGKFLRTRRTPRWKTWFDLCLCVPLLVLALPIMAAIALLVRLTSRGPAVFSQERVGERGRIYTLYKFRSMYVDAEERTGPVWATEDDPRQTPVGRVLRRMHLDELPNLWNVLRGEMSLVGPRPERPEFVEKLADAIPGYVNRLAVRPGITGLAQILLPSDQCVEDVQRKLKVDLYYIRKQSPWLDLKILAVTALRVLRVPLPWCLAITRLPTLRDIGVTEQPVLSRSACTADPAVLSGPSRRSGRGSHDGHEWVAGPLRGVRAATEGSPEGFEENLECSAHASVKPGAAGADERGSISGPPL